jgi:hypothetical protein
MLATRLYLRLAEALDIRNRVLSRRNETGAQLEKPIMRGWRPIVLESGDNDDLLDFDQLTPRLIASVAPQMSIRT